MKKVFVLLAGLVVIGVFCAIIVSMIKRETLIIAFGRIALSGFGAGLAFIGHALLKLARKDVFGGWVVQIAVDGRVIESESENLNPAHGEQMVEYDRFWPVVFFLGGHAHLRRDLVTEDLLRRCCASQGEILGDPRDYATIDQHHKVIAVALRRDLIVSVVLQSHLM